MAEPPEVAVEPDLTAIEREPLHRALLAVPPRQRAVLLLRFAHDLPIDEVALILGCSPGTVKSQASRGLDALREIYQDQFADLVRKVV